MKKISILLIAVVATIASHAQQWVSTTPGNKKALIEEYTGHQCQYCPDGHKIADGLTSGVNAGRVFAINIHAGSFAATGGQYVNILNTPEGEALASNSGLGGYPAGTVNRAKTPWATSRNSWTGEVGGILSQSSPANIAVRSSYDKKTGILKTEVEVYYTADGVGTSNRLHLMLTQDSILGPQSGGTTWYASNFKNGLYIHNKVLRQVLTNINGDTFQTIKKNTFRKFVYETSLPKTIGNVAVDLDNISVTAFLTETLSQVITADKSKVTYDKTKSYTNLLFDHSDGGTLLNFCIDKVNPKVTITNNSAINANTFDMHVTINGKLTIKSVTQQINAGETKTISLGDISFTPSANNVNTIKIIGLFNINGGDFIDNSTLMDNFDKSFISLNANQITGSKNYNYEVGSEVPVIDVTNNPRIINLSKTSSAFGTTPPSWEIGAEGTTNALFLDIRSNSGNNNKDINFLFGRANIPNQNDLKFEYHYAYSDGGKGDQAPVFSLFYSDDCGVVWKKLDETVCTESSPALTPGYTIYVPKNSEYKKKEIDITSLKGLSNIVLKLVVRPGGDGGGLWVDQMKLKLGAATAAVKIMDDSTYRVVGNIASVTDSFVEPKAMFKNLVNNDNVRWRITDVKMAPGWSFAQICDVDCHENVTTGFSKTFAYTAVYNHLLPKFKHNKKAGYGFITIRAFKTSDSASTVTNTKISLLTTTGAATGSIMLSSAVNDRLLYYFDSKIFIDREFNGSHLEIYDLNGKSVLSAKVNSDNIDFTPLTGGIYIARISRDGEILKSHKFTTAK